MSGEMITLEEAQTALEKIFGKDVKIALEPIVPEKEDQLWRFDLLTGIIGRNDRALFEAEVILRKDKGYHQLIIREEPGADEKATKRQGIEGRIIGEVIIERYNGIVVTRHNSGLNGKILELKPSSLSKGELMPEDATPLAFIEANPQRIEGLIAVYVVDVKEPFEVGPDEELMSLEEFIRRTTDGRSLSAIVKAVYLKQ
ncbi:MAG: hypothetical protein KAQ87_00410 [Candidatus Pacebacteria bacterium]|nr:hypothetical protein [Candidatus Paceibacterota bacterium]